MNIYIAIAANMDVVQLDDKHTLTEKESIFANSFDQNLILRIRMCDSKEEETSNNHETNLS